MLAVGIWYDPGKDNPAARFTFPGRRERAVPSTPKKDAGSQGDAISPIDTLLPPYEVSPVRGSLPERRYDIIYGPRFSPPSVPVPGGTR